MYGMYKVKKNYKEDKAVKMFKKYMLVIVSAILLSGCLDTGVEIDIPDITSARQECEKANCTSIFLWQMDGIATSTITPEIVDGTTWLIPMGGWCYRGLNIMDNDAANASFWINMPVTLEYDAASFNNCDASYKYTCLSGKITVTNGIVDVPFKCIDKLI